VAPSISFWIAVDRFLLGADFTAKLKEERISRTEKIKMLLPPMRLCNLTNYCITHLL
jgi:hypothetical protein